jgi:hypothetical protein
MGLSREALALVMVAEFAGGFMAPEALEIDSSGIRSQAIQPTRPVGEPLIYGVSRSRLLPKGELVR